MRKLPDEVKKAKGTFRPSREIPLVKQAALSKWPKAPYDFSDAERIAWKKLGKAVLPLGTVSEADLLMATYLCRMMARLDLMLADPAAKVTALNALIGIVSRLLTNFGLTPHSRNSVAALAQETEEDEDPVSEFA